MTIDPGGNTSAVVQITLGQVFSEVTGMRADLRDLTSAMKTAVGQIGDHETRIRAVERDYVTTEDFDKALTRISALERFKWTVTPIAMALSGGIGAAVTKVMSGH